MPVMELDLGPLAPHDLAEVIAGFLFLALMWFIFAKFVSPMFENMYKERSSQIDGGILRAQKAELEAEAAKQQYEKQLAGARQDAAKVREDAKAQADALTKQLHSQAVKDAERLLTQARAQVAAETVAARDALRGEIGGLATTLAGRIVGQSLSEDHKAQATVDQFIAELSTLETGKAGRS